MIYCREAAIEDIDTITRFQLAMALESEKLQLDPSVTLQGVTALFADPRKGRYYVAENDGVVTGCLLIIDEWSDWRNGMVWWIHSVYVEPSGRRNGTFRALYAHIKDLVERSPSLRGLRLYVDKTNANAQNVYEKLGMTRDHYHLYEWLK